MFRSKNNSVVRTTSLDTAFLTEGDLFDSGLFFDLNIVTSQDDRYKVLVYKDRRCVIVYLLDDTGTRILSRHFTER